MALICGYRNCDKPVKPDKFNPDKMFCSRYCKDTEYRLFKADEEARARKNQWNNLLDRDNYNRAILEQCILSELELSGEDNHMLARDLVRFARQMDMHVFAEHLKLRLVVMEIDIMSLNYGEKYEWFT